MEDARILRIAELLQLGLPLTGAFYFRRSSRSRPISFMPSRSNATPFFPDDPDSVPKFLTPLIDPTIIIGILSLPDGVVTCASASNPRSRCHYKSCFQFTDGSAVVCCDILDLDIRMIGKEIRVLCWNFIPLRKGVGLLEIIKWSFPDSSLGHFRRSSTDSFPLNLGSSFSLKDRSNARYSFFGVLDSVSPVSTVPCTFVRLSTDKDACSSSGSEKLCGFLVQVFVCKCRVCTSKESVMILRGVNGEHDTHSFVTPEFVYFCGFASSWHPVIAKLVGRFVRFSGFKRKKAFISKKESSLMYVTTEKSTLSLSSLSKKRLDGRKIVLEGKGECGSYCGIIKGVYMQGMVVELDGGVCLLLTDQSLAPSHSLRVGSIISVKNVHFVNPQFSWGKVLVLGVCVKTSISVESFSPLETRCHVLSLSTSMIGKFIGSLPFSERLWALLIVSSFRKMFAGILSEKEILGSKHKEGLVQIYASSHIPFSVLQSQHGVLMEFNKHRSCLCGREPWGSYLKSVIPVSSFISFCEIKWTGETQLKYGSGREGENNQTIRKTYQSEDLGFTLVGLLKQLFKVVDFEILASFDSLPDILYSHLFGNISPYSGRLQLVDATGGIDILVPDLPSNLNVSSIFEVTKYSLVIEGIPQLVDGSGLVNVKLFSCRNLFHSISSVKNLKVAIYVHFHYKDATRRSLPLYLGVEWKDEFDKPERGRYLLLQIKHKFPLAQNFHGSLMKSVKSSLFIEAVIFSWNLILGKDDLTDFSREQPIENPIIENCENNINKRCKFAAIGKSSDSMNDFGDYGCGFYVSRECKKIFNLNNHKISCFATVRGFNGNQGISGFLINKDDNISIDRCMPSARRVLLEFNADNFFSYQSLQIGNHYILKCHKEDSLSNLEDFARGSSLKFLMSSHIHLWEIFFTTDWGLHNSIPFQSTWNDISFGSTEVLSKVEVKLCPRTSVVCLHFSGDIRSLLDTIIQNLELSSKRVLRSKEINYDSQCHESECLFPEGNLLSLDGHVIAVNNYPDLVDGKMTRFFQQLKCNSCIHLSVDNCIVIFSSQLVRIIGSTDLFPIGFGPGISASFHRILDLRGENLLLTPVSYIVINHNAISNEPNIDIRASNKSNIVIKEANEPNYNKIKSDMGNKLSNCPISSGLVSELFRCSNANFQRIKLNCRVVAVSVMVLEKKRNYVIPPDARISSKPPFHIPLAAFILDDGSSACCCWSRGERAETLLRLHELLPSGTFGSSGCVLDRVGMGHKSCTTASDLLDRVLRNHDRIVVKSFGSMLGSSNQDIDVCISSDSALSIADESLIKFIILNVCHGTIWTVLANRMDTDAVRSLMEEHNIQMEMTRSVQSIWAREVSCTNSLAEARNIMVELTDSVDNMTEVPDQQSPSSTTMQQSYSIPYSYQSSYGPFVGVLGDSSLKLSRRRPVVIGRLCSATKIMGYDDFDVESWVEAKCSTCINGRIAAYPPPPPPPPPPAVNTPTQRESK